MKNIDKLIECLSNSRLSLPMSLNLIGVVKADLMRVVRSYPTVVVVGKHSTGKTPLAEACLIDCTQVSAFDSPGRVVKKYIGSRTCVLVDDIADIGNRCKRENIRGNFETIIRKAYSGEGPLALFTAETGAMEKLIPSGKQRIIPIAMDSGIDDGEFSCLLTYLQESTTDFRELLNKYREFYKESNYSNKLITLLNTFRERYREMATDVKRLNMVFCYYYSMLILNELLARRNAGGGIPVELLVKEYLTVTVQKAESLVETKSWTERVLERALEEKLFRPQCPHVKHACLKELKQGCDNSFNCYDCEQWGYPDKIDGYSLGDLVLQYGKRTNSLLLLDTQYLYYAKRLFVHGGVLIIDSYILLEIMNNVAILMFKETGEERELFTSQKLHAELYKLHRCMAHPNGNSLRYTMGYPADGVDENGEIKNVRVVVLRLKEEEVLKLYELENECDLTDIEKKYPCESGRVSYTLSQIWGGMTFRLGKIGKSNSCKKSIEIM